MTNSNFINVSEIPQAVLDAEQIIIKWMDENNIQDWALGGIQKCRCAAIAQEGGK